MSRQHTARNLVISFVLFASLACAIPGLQPAVTVPPTTMPLEVIIANTASAAQTQTQQAAPAVMQATETVTPVVLPTITPSPIFSDYGTALVTREDQTILFIDRTSGFQITFPSNWVPVRVNHDEFYSLSVNEAVTTYPFLTTELRIISDHDPNKTRVHAFDVAQGHMQDQYVPHISVHWVGEVLPLMEGASSHLEYIRSQNPEATVVTPPTELTTQNGITAAMIEFTVPGKSLASTLDILPYERRIYFHSNNGSVYIIFSALSDVREQVIPEFDQIINSITLFQP